MRTLLLMACLSALAGAQDAGPAREVMAFVSDRDGNREIYLLANGKTVNLTRHPAEDWYPAWSPDARRMVFTSSRDEGWDLYVVTLADSKIRRLTREAGWNGCATWSPDGGRILFHTSRDQNWEIYVMKPDGTGAKNLSRSEAHERMPAWSPDGKRIAFETDRDGDSEVYVMDADGSNVRNLTKHGAEDLGPSWSPDGKRLAFHSDREGKVQIFTASADGGDVKRLSDASANDVYPVWTLDGKKIVFHSDRDGDWDVYVMNVDGTGLKNLTNSDANDSWSPVAFGRVGAVRPAPALNAGSVSRDVAAMVRSWKSENRKANLGLLRDAIRPTLAAGGASYNKGDAEGCAKLYRETASRLGEGFGREASTAAASAALEGLRTAVKRANEAGAPDRASWALRYAFDRAIVSWNLRNSEVRTLVRLGDQYFSIRRYAEAEDAFAAAAELLPELVGSDPEQVEMASRLAPFALANARFARGRFKSAVRAIASGLPIIPKWPQTKLNVRQLHREPQDFDRRLGQLEESVGKNPNDADLRFLLGYACHFTGRKPEARAHFKKALELSPDHAGARAFQPARSLKGEEF